MTDGEGRSLLEAAYQSSFDALATADHAVLDAIPAAVYVCDAEGLLVCYNRRAVQLWGREPKLGDPAHQFCGAWRLFYPDGQSLPHDETPMAVAVQTGQAAQDIEVVIERPDGTRITAAVNIRALTDRHGRIQGAINCFQDITDRMILERDLRESRADLEDFFENAAVALHVVGGDGRVLQANRAELELLGYSREKYVGRHIADFHVDAEVIADILARLSRGEPLHSYPARLRAKDGTIKHVLITSNAKREGKILRRTRCFSLDITDRVHAEEALRASERQARALVEALPVAVYTTDAAGSISFHNRAAASLWGRDPVYGPEGDSWCGSWRLFSAEGTPLPHDQCPMAVALKTGIPIRGAEAGAERPDGTRVPFLAYPTPLHDPSSGKLLGAVNTLVDISERKQNEARLQLLVDELNHRVKNTLATVQAIAVQTLRTTPSIEAFGASFQARLWAFSKTHDLLTGNHWEGAELRQLLLQELAPYVEGDAATAPRVRLEGQQVFLAPGAAVALGIAFHEMTTNAIKHGSLATAHGSVQALWHIESDKLHINWSERGGVRSGMAPTRRGFGTRAIDATIRDQLGGAIERMWHTDGLLCSIELPFRRITQGEID